jgi:hypothetical protein
MAVAADTRTVVKAWVVPWEPVSRSASGEPNDHAFAVYRIACETADGQSGASRIGKRSGADSIVREIEKQRLPSRGQTLNPVGRADV